MTRLPIDIGTIHFVGIGGIGMSGIAEIMHSLGYSVQGSDLSENANVARLQGLGIPVAIGHRPENLAAAEIVVISSAVKSDNEELVTARKRRIPVVRRAEMLGELMRLKSAIAVGGTHGKTTTTSMIAAVMSAARYDPTVINGGIINAYGTNAHLGDGDWIVVEADESDGTFIRLPATVAVVTNIDPEHLDHYGDFDTLRAAFDTFVGNIPFYGFAALCIDNTEVQSLIGRVTDRRIVTYGLSPQADVRAVNLRPEQTGTRFDVVLSGLKDSSHRTIKDLFLPMVGRHNVENALAAITIASELGVDDTVLTRALAGFEGVKRRYTRVGEAGGVTIIDDYGHHPVEIAAVLNAARSSLSTADQPGQIIAVVQPHRYSRLEALFEEFCTCFNDADVVVVADIYAAGELPIAGVDREAFVEGLRSHGHRRVVELPSPDDLPAIVADLTGPGDLVVCLGAGTITSWAASLPARLDALARPGDLRANGGPS